MQFNLMTILIYQINFLKIFESKILSKLALNLNNPLKILNLRKMELSQKYQRKMLIIIYNNYSFLNSFLQSIIYPLLLFLYDNNMY